ncbi:MAG: YbjN domain-containing protein [Dehalococcoidia bacterium]
MQQVIRSVLSAMDITFVEANDHFSLAMRGDYGLFDIEVRTMEQPPLLWLRTSLPVRARGEQKAAVLEAALALNYTRPMVKLGHDPSDGEIVLYLDVPVIDRTLTEVEFATYLAVVIGATQDILPRLLKVALGCESVAQSLCLPVPSRRRARRRMSRAEREAREIVERLDIE